MGRSLRWRNKNMICFDFGTSIDWTALSSMATAVMAVATFATIYYNRKQIKEIQRQWDETNRARLTFNIIASDGFFYLKIENIGNETAYDVKISINNSFLDQMLVQDFKDSLKALCKKNLYFPPKRIMYYSISPIYSSDSTLKTKHALYSSEETNKNLDILINEPLIITGEYNNNRKTTETLTINNSIGSVIVKTPEIQKLGCICEELKTVNKNLQDIAKKN